MPVDESLHWAEPSVNRQQDPLQFGADLELELDSLEAASWRRDRVTGLGMP